MRIATLQSHVRRSAIGATRGSAPCDRQQARCAAFLLCIVLLGAALTACKTTTESQVHDTFPVPPGWHDITPPTSQRAANYAVSPDVPGLIVGCIGDLAGDLPSGSAAPVGPTQPYGPARLWRTLDGGAHWQIMRLPGLMSGCSVIMPLGGRGTLFTIATQGNPASETLMVSHDEGATWHTVNTTSLAAEGIDAYGTFDLISRAVAHNGVLYSFGGLPLTAAVVPEAAMNALAMSPDDGATWSYVNPQFDPRFIGYGPIALAPDYRAPGAWFRLLFASSGSAQPAGLASPLLLEHSGDDAQTWQVVGDAGQPGNGKVPFSIVRAALVTSPQYPTRLCMAVRAQLLYPWQVPSPLPTPTPTPGPIPPPLQQVTMVLGSDNAGATWTGGEIERHTVGATFIPAARVSMDPAGNCVTADDTDRTAGGPAPQITFYRLGHDATARPVAIVTIPDQTLQLGTVFQASTGGAARLLLVSSVPDQRSCSPTCANVSAGAPHVLWEPEPA